MPDVGPRCRRAVAPARRRASIRRVRSRRAEAIAAPGPGGGCTSLPVARLTAPPTALPARHRLYIRPTGLTTEPAGWPLAGGPINFTGCQVIVRGPDAIQYVPLALGELDRWRDGAAPQIAESCTAQIARLTASRAGLPWLAGGPAIMGVLNVTPDSFSDGGRFDTAEAAIAEGRAQVAAGAGIIDVGGESTRPGAQPVAPDVECARTLPVVRGLAAHRIPVSIDTRNAVTMRAAVAAGAAMINDISALRHDPASPAEAAAASVAVVLGHLRGDPKNMQDDPTYGHAPLDVYDALARRRDEALAAGIPIDHIVLDPGIGFGKSMRHNLEILAWLSLFHGLGCRLMLGVSRKGFIGRLTGEGRPMRRGPGSLAAGLAGLDRGIDILRVHDVGETAQAVKVWRAIRESV